MSDTESEQVPNSNVGIPSSPDIEALGYGARDEDVLENCCIDHSPQRVATRPRNLVVCIDGTTQKFGRNVSIR